MKSHQLTNLSPELRLKPLVAVPRFKNITIPYSV